MRWWKIIDKKLEIYVNNLNNCFLEKFRTLGKQIELKRKKILMVTSILDGEGKTTVAINLARSLANTGKRVIFVDCDLRNSKTASLYGIKNTNANIECYLNCHKDLKDIILKSEENNLHLILAARSSLNSIELFDSKRFRMMLMRLKENYDFIIIDTPSITKYIDAMIIARETDAVILVIQKNRVKKKVAKESLKQLREVKCEILGVVFNELEV